VVTITSVGEVWRPTVNVGGGSINIILVLVILSDELGPGGPSFPKLPSAATTTYDY